MLSRFSLSITVKVTDQEACNLQNYYLRAFKRGYSVCAMLVRKNEVAACFHSPYIEYGYRKVRNFREAFCSLFVLHNESMNIWSHFIGFICIVLAGVNLSYDVIIVSSSSRFFEIIAVEGYLIGAIFCLLFSAAFHWFGCLSELHYDFLLKVDLTGVALLITGSYLPGIYYGEDY